MGRRSRRRGADAPLRAAASRYEHPDHGVLVLRGALTPGTRAEYERVRSGMGDAPGAAREDAWQRAVEFLFERLAVSWTVAGVETAGPKELLGRLRFAGQDERRWVRESLRSHCAEHFPDVEAP